MRSTKLLSLLFAIVFIAPISKIHAAPTDPIDYTATISATVPVAVPTGSDTIAPTPPILIRPIDDSVTSDTTPEFVWRPATDPNSNFVEYTLYLDDVAVFLGISSLGNSSGTGYTAEIHDNEIRLIPTIHLTEGHHTWKVVASDKSGNTSTSTIWDLTIDTTPPFILITDIDIYHNLALDSRVESSVPEGTTFNLSGPKDAYFHLLTEPFSYLSLSFTKEDSPPIILQGQANELGRLILYSHLDLGLYHVQASATDLSNLTVVLPIFDIMVEAHLLTIPIPGITHHPTLTIPPPIADLPYLFSDLPVTIARIDTRVNLASIFLLMLAILLLILLILLKKRRFNLILLDSHSHPLGSATIYHSRPDSFSNHNNHLLHTPVLITHRSPTKYRLKPKMRGKIHIPHLSMYSTLTIRSNSSLLILSISRRMSVYTIYLDVNA